MESWDSPSEDESDGADLGNGLTSTSDHDTVQSVFFSEKELSSTGDAALNTTSGGDPDLVFRGIWFLRSWGSLISSSWLFGCSTFH